MSTSNFSLAHFKFLTEAACGVARKAGAAMMQVYSRALDQGFGVSYKSDESPLTEADLAAHRAIAQGLQAIDGYIPVVSEEDEASWGHRKAEGLFWLVDPLDGTKEFIERNGQFTVNISLVCDGFPAGGVVYAPAQGRLYWGGQGFGAYRQLDQSGAVNDQLLLGPVLPHEKPIPMRVLASKSHLNAETEAFLNALGPSALIQAGSSLKFCTIAEGGADLYPRMSPTCEWDTAAAQAVLEGAGGGVWNLQGARLNYGKPDKLNPSFIAGRTPWAWWAASI